MFSFPEAPEDLEAPVSAALPVLLSAGRRHPPGDRACAASGAAAGQSLSRGNMCRHLRPPAGTCLSAREGEQEEDSVAPVASKSHVHDYLNVIKE